MVKVSKWTEQEERYLIKWWHHKSNLQIAKDLGKSESNVRARADKIITFEMMSRRKWSEYELDLLQKLYGTMHIDDLCSRMKRSKIAIDRKIRELEGTALATALKPVYNTIEVAGFLGVVRISVERYIKRGDIPFYKANKNYIITQDAFWGWLKDNLDKPQYKSIKPEYELDSPEWYKEIIKQKKRELRNNKVLTKWTSMDDALLWSEMMKGTPYKVIANELGRGINSIWHRASYLSKKKMQNVS